MGFDRREFISTTGLLTVSAFLGGALSAQELVEQKDYFINNTEHRLPKLPYMFNELEPIIDAPTLEIHYQRHHQGYVNGLNKAEAEITLALSEKNFSLIDYWSKKLAFHGAGNYLHTLYWNSMSPNGGSEPTGLIKDLINTNFGSFEKFKMMFTAAAKTVEGSGWGMLAYNPSDKKLVVLQVENHQKLTTWNVIPLMVIDVWEHAYYLKYQNRRAEYLDAWWDVANWNNVNKILNVHPNEKD